MPHINTLNRYGKVHSKRMVLNVLSKFRDPLSTYKLTRDVKRVYNVNVSDTTILDLLKELKTEGLVSYLSKSKARYWFLKKNA